MRKYYSELFSLSALLLVAATAPPGRAQSVTETTVLTNPPGPWVYVDSTPFYAAMSAFWPVGSVHTLTAGGGTGYSYNYNATIQYQFQNWSWSGGAPGTSMLPTIQVIADPSITHYTANYNALYQFTIQVACSTGPCGTFPGVITLAGVPVVFGTNGAQSSWQAPGSAQALQVTLNTGWIFAGWQVGNSPLVTGATYSATVNTPLTVTAVFVPAKTVNFATNPPNLDIYADRTLTVTPNSLPWGLGTSHTVGALTVQSDNNEKVWAFQSWSDGGAATHTYVVGANSNPETITANYAAAAYPFFSTSPANLNLTVDGLVLPPPYSYIWGIGSTHTVSAPSPQTDAQGNVWVFKSWDDLVTTNPRTITIPVGADANGYHLIAEYTRQAKMTVSSTLAGQVVTVNGSPCTTPCSLALAMGSQVDVSAPASVPVSGASRQDFLGWSAGGGAPVAGDWIATLNSPNTSLVATYHLMNSLTTAASPSGGATWSISPASPDGFYDSRTQVSVAVTARPGYRFTSWSGDLSGSTPSGQLTMSVPHSVVALFGAVPYIAPSGVSNAAGSASQTGVAPGSVASIFGVNLTAATAVGPATPLVQTLAGVTVHTADSLMPLYFASPAQINLQIPPGLALGPQTITVSSPGMPDVNSAFTIVRNAPGLFPVVLDGQTYALVLHEDGSLVTAAAPAQQGELLTAYGTGFGPTDPARPDGFAVPLTPPYLAVDPVTVQVGASVFTPVSSFAAPGQVGLDLVQFKLDSTAPSGAAIPLYVTVNGINSNTLPMPIQ